MAVSKEKIRKIYEILPKLNCGFCGFGSCGQFAGLESVITMKRNAGRREDSHR